MFRDREHRRQRDGRGRRPRYSCGPARAALAEEGRDMTTLEGVMTKLKFGGKSIRTATRPRAVSTASASPSSTSFRSGAMSKSLAMALFGNRNTNEESRSAGQASLAAARSRTKTTFKPTTRSFKRTSSSSISCTGGCRNWRSSTARADQGSTTIATAKGESSSTPAGSSSTSSISTGPARRSTAT